MKVFKQPPGRVISGQFYSLTPCLQPHSRRALIPRTKTRGHRRVSICIPSGLISSHEVVGGCRKLARMQEQDLLLP